MLKDYLIIERSALPDYFLLVVEARKLLESGACAQVSDAVQRVGISRSTYYKYRDRIIEPAEFEHRPEGHADAPARARGR